MAQQNGRPEIVQAKGRIFPILDYTARTVHGQQKQIDAIQNKVTTLEGTCSSFSSLHEAQQEFMKLMTMYGESTFNIKKTHYQAPLRRGIADLYCCSLFRKPSDEEKLVNSVLRSDKKYKYKCTAALKYVNGLLATFRSEERRRVLQPTRKYKDQDTKALAELIIGYMKASYSDSFNHYYQNLVLLRKYVREHPSAKSEKNLFGCFKKWVNETCGFASSESIAPSKWQEWMRNVVMWMEIVMRWQLLRAIMSHYHQRIMIIWLYLMMMMMDILIFMINHQFITYTAKSL